MRSATTYYELLGVDPVDSTAAFYAAYADLNRRRLFRPFAPIEEAFQVLADPRRRSHYDQELQSAGPEPLRPQEPEPEPLSILNDARNVRPSAEALHERLERNFTGRGVPKSEHPEPLTVELLPSGEEDRADPSTLVGIPTLQVCAECHGSGLAFLHPCSKCGGKGFLEVVRAVPVSFGEVIEGQMVVEQSLEDIGIVNLYLRVLRPAS